LHRQTGSTTFVTITDVQYMHDLTKQSKNSFCL